MKKFRLIMTLALAAAAVAAHAQFLDLNISPDTVGVIQTSASDLNTVWGEPGINERNPVLTGLRLSPEWHYYGYFVNTLSDFSVSTYFAGGAIHPAGQMSLDRPQLALPAPFDGNTIPSITFDGDDQGKPNGDSFHADITLAMVPEPTPYLVFGLGALVLALGRWRSLRSRKR
jgi:hypothetical protein